VGVIALGVIIIIAALAIQKGASAASDDLSKQSHAKFEALIPPSAHQTPAPERKEQTMTRSTAKPAYTDTGYVILREEMSEFKSKLDKFIIVSSERLEKDKETQVNVENLASQISDLGNRVSKVEELTEQVRTLKDSLLLSQEELKKLRASLDEQNLKLGQLAQSSVEMNAALDHVRGTMRPPHPGEVDRTLSGTETATTYAYTRRCIYCGSSLEKLDRFCNRCGRRAV